MRMEVSSFAEVMFNPVAQAKFVHTISAGYVTGAMFVLSISAYFLLRGRNFDFAKRSLVVAIAFGLASALSVVVLGDESGYEANANQKMKLAAIEGMWHTEKAPANLTLFGIPDDKTQTTKYAISIPYALGLIATRSVDQKVEGIHELIDEGKQKIKDGILAYQALVTLQNQPNNPVAKETFEAHQQNLGYALLLKKYTKDIGQATAQEIHLAAQDLAPHVLPLFFSFRIMVACGFFFIALFATGFYLMIMRRAHHSKWFLKTAFYALPLPWIAAELGWVIAEYGRQPWVVQGILPTFMGTSSINFAQIMTSLLGFVLFYSILAVVELYLMIKYIRLGPDGLQF